MKTILYITPKYAYNSFLLSIFPRMKTFYILFALAISTVAYSADARPYRVHQHNRPTVDASLQRASEGGMPTPTVASTQTASTSADTNHTFTRSAFVTLVTERMYAKDISASCFQNLSNSRYTHLFRDVPVNSPYARHVCVALDTGLIDSTENFHPDASVNIAEAAKVLSKAYNAGHLNRTVPSHMSWHQLYEDDLRRRGAIPTQAKQASYIVTEADALWMMEKLEPLRQDLLAQQKTVLRPSSVPMPSAIKPN
jgi:hypothetical protein